MPSNGCSQLIWYLVHWLCWYSTTLGVGTFSYCTFNVDILESKTVFQYWLWTNEPPRDKTNKMACALSEDSDQPGHLPSLIRVFAVRMKKAWVLSYLLSTQRRLWSDWADAQADLSLRWAHSHIVGFVMSRLKCCKFVLLLDSWIYLTFFATICTLAVIWIFPL